MPSRVETIAVELPQRRVTSEALLDRVNVTEKPPLVQVTGIKERRVADPDVTSLDLAIGAALNALSLSNHSRFDIDLVLYCSITRTVTDKRTQMVPSMASLVSDAIGTTRARSFDVANACAGMATGLVIADRMIKAGAARRVLIVSGEKISAITETAVREISDGYDPQFAALTVGDSGCALIIDDAGTPFDGIEHVSLTTAAEAAQLCVAMPSDRSEGVAMYTDNKRMHSESRYTQGLQYIQLKLAEMGGDIDDFDYLIHHQFSMVAIDYLRDLAVNKVFGKKMPPELNVLPYLGNTSSTALFVVLEQHLRTREFQAGDRVMLVPSASGMVYGLISMTIGEELL